MRTEKSPQSNLGEDTYDYHDDSQIHETEASRGPAAIEQNVLLS